MGETVPARAGDFLIKLPMPRVGGALSLEQAIKTRRTVRDFSGRGLGVAQLSQLLWAAQGVTGAAGGRAAPSAKAHYPLQLYLVAGRVDELECGSYAYSNDGHELELHMLGDVRSAVCNAALEDQRWIAGSAAIIVITADLQRSGNIFREQPPRGERGARYVWMEVGAVAQNVYLQAQPMKLGAALVGGFDDAAVGALLRLPGRTSAVALLCLGYPA